MDKSQSPFEVVTLLTFIVHYIFYIDTTSSVNALRAESVPVFESDLHIVLSMSMSFLFNVFFFVPLRQNLCPTLDQERSSASEFSPSSSFSSLYWSWSSGRKSNSGKTRTSDRAWVLTPLWTCQLFPQRPPTCCTRPARAPKGSSSKQSVCPVPRGRQALSVRWEAAAGALHRSWCARQLTLLSQEV